MSTPTPLIRDVEAVRDQLHAISRDAKRDARSLDGMPFTGSVVARVFGLQLSMIARLAEIVETLLPEGEPEPDPVPYKDYLPCLDTGCGPAAQVDYLSPDGA